MATEDAQAGAILARLADQLQVIASNLGPLEREQTTREGVDILEDLQAASAQAICLFALLRPIVFGMGTITHTEGGVTVNMDVDIDVDADGGDDSADEPTPTTDYPIRFYGGNRAFVTSESGHSVEVDYDAAYTMFQLVSGYDINAVRIIAADLARNHALPD